MPYLSRQVGMQATESSLQVSRAGRNPALARGLVYLLLAFAGYRFWVAPLRSSFWLDETGTFWAIKDGISAMMARIQQWPTTVSPVYGFIAWMAYALGGAREYVLRLPSVIAIVCATVLIYRLAKRLLDEKSALPAAVVFMCAPTVTFAGSDARAYAVLLLAVAGSTLALVRWLEYGATRDAVVYVVSAALMPHVHYLACMVIPVQAAYALARYREGAPVRLRQLILAAAGIGVLVAPLIPFFITVLHNRRQSAFMPEPTFFDLGAFMVPPILIFGSALGLGIAWIIGRVRGHNRLEAAPLRVRASATVLMLALATVPPFLLFAISRLSSVSVFVPRYMIACQVGLALLAGWAMGRLQPATARMIVIASVLVYSIQTLGAPEQRWPAHGAENWRLALADIRQIAGREPVAVFVQTGLIEARKLNLNFGGETPSYLLSPLAMYPAAGRVILIPPINTPRGQEFLESQLVPMVQNADRFIVLARDDNYSAVLIAARLPGFTSHPVDDFGKVNVFVYQRRASGASASQER